MATVVLNVYNVYYGLHRSEIFVVGNAKVYISHFVADYIIYYFLQYL